MGAKLRLATVGESIELTPLARAARRFGPPVAVVVSVEPLAPGDDSLADVGRRLLGGEIDAALVPASSVPLPIPAGVEVGAVLRCHEAAYRWVSPHYAEPPSTPAGSRVVAWDACARAQLLHRFPSLVFEWPPPSGAIRPGLAHGVWRAAVVPSEAVRNDAELFAASTPLSPRTIVPAVGLGLAAVLTASRRRSAVEAVRLLNDPAAANCLATERAFLSRIRDLAPGIATALATQTGGTLAVTAVLAERDGGWVVSDATSGPARFGEILAFDLAESCSNLAREAVGPW